MLDKARQLCFQDKIKEQTVATYMESEEYNWVSWLTLSTTFEAKTFVHYWFPFVSLLVFNGTSEQAVGQTKVENPRDSQINFSYQTKAMPLTLQHLKSLILACCSAVKLHFSAEWYAYVLNL